MTPPKQVYTRRTEMIEAAGYKPSEVPVDGFDETGFEVLLIAPDGLIWRDWKRAKQRHAGK